MNSDAKSILEQILMQELFADTEEAIELVSERFIKESEGWVEKAESAGFTTIKNTRDLVTEYLRCLDCGEILVDAVIRENPSYFPAFADSCGGRELSKFELYMEMVKSIKNPGCSLSPKKAGRIARLGLKSQDLFYFIDLYYLKIGKSIQPNRK